MAFFLDTLFGSLTPMCVTALVTLAITLIFKTSFTTNFAQGVVSAFGAYFVATMLTKWGYSIWLSVPAGMLVSMLMAIVIDVGIFRRGRYVNALGKQIITMGLISIIVGATPLVYGIATPLFKPFIDGVKTFEVAGGSVAFTWNSIFCAGITAIVIVLIFVLLKYSKWGLSVRATASNEYVAGMMGINTHIVTALSWGIAGALGALAASINASSGTTINIYFMTNYQVYAFLAGILGGFSTFHGPVIAALMIPLANNLISYLVNVANRPDLTGWSMVFVYVIALVIIFFKPQGIFGKKIAKKV
ncbi:MAG: branched-chain amino acid ABC transporter permease [Clostridiales bacterium]|nr:branched-chain amino acid ABC transporter permease [Clostridiales bacterium]